MANRNPDYVLIQVSLPPEEAEAFKRYCAAVKYPMSTVARTLFRNLTGQWRRRLSPQGWANFMAGELSKADMDSIYRRSVEPQPAPDLLVVAEQKKDSDAA
jgi:hypothetical protein